RTVTGVGELSRQELQLKQEVVRRCPAVESKRVWRGAETPADIFPCEQITKIVGSMFAQAAPGERAQGQCAEAALAEGLGQCTIAGARAGTNAARFEVGFLQVEPNAVLKLHKFNVEIGDVFSFRDFAWGAEVGVTPDAVPICIRSGNRNCVRFVVDGGYG